MFMDKKYIYFLSNSWTRSFNKRQYTVKKMSSHLGTSSSGQTEKFNLNITTAWNFYLIEHIDYVFEFWNE